MGDASATEGATTGGTGSPEVEEGKTPRSPDRVEERLRPLENTLFLLRHIILIPVIFSFIGTLVMFGVGIYETWVAIQAFVEGDFDIVTIPLIKALDAYLIGIILIIFSFGIYDFFISEFNPSVYGGFRPDWLKFDNVGQLKNKIIEVVIVVLVISFFELMVANFRNFDTFEGYLTIPLGTAILAISLGIFKKLTQEEKSGESVAHERNGTSVRGSSD